VRYHLVLLVVLAAVLGPAVSGAALPPVLVPEDVRVAGVDVSGMRPDLAHRLLQRRFDRPIRFTYGEKRWQTSTSLLAGAAAFRLAVDRALAAPPGSRLELPVAVQKDWVRHYVDFLARAFHRPAVNAKLVGLRGLKPYVRPAKYGRRVLKAVMVRKIVRNLLHQRRVPIELATAPVAPKRLRADILNLQIVIRRLSNRLYVYRGGTFWKSFGVATGSPSYPTPTGDFKIADMQRWPTWTPPPSPWAKGAKPIPPGPNNPLGTRWMGLDTPYVGIHGTPNSASIGYSASHGCIRMLIPDAEWLFDRAVEGTPVYIRDA
jgi:lipoprotein-anchoring transpeptidase ErfK/SrfK